MRRITAIFTAAVIAAALTTAIFASTASALSPVPCPTGYEYGVNAQTGLTTCIPTSTRLAPLHYRGWVNLVFPQPTGTGCYTDAAGYTACGGPVLEQLTAWRWSGRAWSRTVIGPGEYYAWPYTGQWRWVWSADTGWLAVTGGTFVYS